MTTQNIWHTSTGSFLAKAVLCAGLFIGSLATSTANAGTLTASITDARGLALEHAIVSLLGKNSGKALAGTKTHVDQKSRRFAPTVLPIQTGTEVSFPNTDDVRHHVYSFSQPNAFELKLYHGEASRPILFDEPGIVVLGCNIHDGMVGYLMVVDTPLFAKTTASGEAQVADVPPGKYTIQIWHPDLGMDVVKKSVKIGSGNSSIAVSLKTTSSTFVDRESSPLQSLFDDY